MKIIFLVLNNQMCQETKFISLTCETVSVNNTLKALKAVKFKACKLFSAYIDEPHDQ